MCFSYLDDFFWHFKCLVLVVSTKSDYKMWGALEINWSLRPHLSGSFLMKIIGYSRFLDGITKSVLVVKCVWKTLVQSWVFTLFCSKYRNISQGIALSEAWLNQLYPLLFRRLFTLNYCWKRFISDLRLSQRGYSLSLSCTWVRCLVLCFSS